MDCETWIPVSTGKFPDDMEDVQVTYIGFTDGRPYCDEFAYRNGSQWRWSHDDGVVMVDIIAWKHNCKPYGMN